jgi:hypothetical protein
MWMMLKSRRTFIAVIAIILLGIMGIYKGIDTSMSISAVAIGLAGANAYQKKGGKDE